MRAFLAFKPGEDLLSYLTDIQKVLRKKNVGGRYTLTSNIHLTAAFLGETDKDETVKEILGKYPFRGGDLLPKGLDFFGDIIVLKIAADEEITSYVKKLRNELKVRGIYFDSKPFSPHITLVRASSGINKYELDILNRSLVYKNYHFDTINLYRSDVKDKIRIYTVI